MNISNIVQVGTQLAGRTLLKTQKHSPELLVGAGIVGVVVAGVMVARATLKLDPVVNDFKDSVDVIDHVADVEKWSDNKRNKELAHVYGKGAWEFVKLYGPPVTLGAASIACILGGTHILKQRNVALAAAYKVLEKSYSEYRRRVADEFGEEVEGRIYRDQGYELTQVVNSDGTVSESLELTQGVQGYSPYARIFDESNPNYKRGRADMNQMFVISVQRYLDQRLRTYGHVFLNEAYDALGFERTREGSVVGWLYGGSGDGYIDFGIDDPNNPMGRMFVVGDEPSVILDFNVDGTIWDKI